jgi:hypothetical protein
MKAGEIWRQKGEDKEEVEIVDIRYEFYNEKFGTDYSVYFRYTYMPDFMVTQNPRSLFVERFYYVRG